MWCNCIPPRPFHGRDFLQNFYDVVDMETAAQAVREYPKTEIGIPVIYPFFNNDRVYHNNSSWPFATTFFLSAAEKALDKSQCAYNLALLARMVREDGFHELVDMRSGEPVGNGHQLWSASAFINTCLRAEFTTVEK